MGLAKARSASGYGGRPLVPSSHGGSNHGQRECFAGAVEGLLGHVSSQQCAVDGTVTAHVAPPRLLSLTGLRYFAALAVVFVHIGAEFVDSSPVAAASSYGYIGVTFFFLLSGFVLTWSYSAQPVARFWWLRFSRIWPLNMALMVVWFTIVVERAHLPEPWDQTAALLMLQAWDPRQSVYFVGNFVSWSLSCEMFFYLLFPFAILGVRRLRARGLVVTGVGTAALLLIAPLALHPVVSGTQFRWLFYIFPPYRFGEFLMGMLVARAAAIGVRVRSVRAGWSATAAGLAILAVGFTWFTLATGRAVERPLVAVLALPFLVLLLLTATAAETGSGRVWLGRAPLVRLGQWSFALYLVHEPLFQLTQRWGWWDESRGGFRGLTNLLAFLVVATLLAAALYYAVERPAERLLRRFAGKSTPRPAPVPDSDRSFGNSQRQISGSFGGVG